ncbi:hypothetical protein [Mucilaginibacter sp. SP1R1]|uniref:hypothetical protein n=1 Tax=Mucilaginibacter sp. SP1R1 TaxID=2723091 RepID=UPI00161C6D13|nr:hypothetical protein [Mucilaginibacter sp. SP1R1]MBB6148497.1 hypothetical protein [Mucilaginibacter sp. SP1R1]
MNWDNIKEQIYFEDGSLRDIYVLNTTRDDWYRWIEYVNSNYPVNFYNHGLDEDIQFRQIDPQAVTDRWDGKSDYNCIVIVRIKDAYLKAHFFAEDEIENDISPKEFNSEEQHLALLKYLQEVSQLLNKKVILTDESRPERVLLLVKRGKY